MNIKESMAVALEGLASNKMRALLTMLGIIIGVSAVITMLALANGASSQMMNNIKAMGTNDTPTFTDNSLAGDRQADPESEVAAFANRDRDSKSA